MASFLSTRQPWFCTLYRKEVKFNSLMSSGKGSSKTKTKREIDVFELFTASTMEIYLIKSKTIHLLMAKSNKRNLGILKKETSTTSVHQ